MKKDIVIAYRIFPGITKVPPVYSTDKYRLSEFCLNSFKRALGSLTYKMYILLDGCPNSYKDMFISVMGEENLVFYELNKVGNEATFKMQLDILTKQDDADIVYLAEDDYFYFPDAIEKMVKAIQTQGVDFLTAYDHLDYYTDKNSVYGKKTELKVIDNLCWRNVVSTCLTFMTTKKNLQKTKDVFMLFSTKELFDASVWLALTKKSIFSFMLMLFDEEAQKRIKEVIRYVWRQYFFGRTYKLFVPVPTLATHMESDFLPPYYDWKKILN